MEKLVPSGGGLDLLANAACAFSKESPEEWASHDDALTTQSCPLVPPSTKSPIETKRPPSTVKMSSFRLPIKATPIDCRWRTVSLSTMVRILLQYGPEIPARNWDGKRFKHPSLPSSIRRMFIKANPTFFEHFTNKRYCWMPLAGKDQEIKRRAEMRKSFEQKKQLRKKRNSSSTQAAAVKEKTMPEATEEQTPSAVAERTEDVDKAVETTAESEAVPQDEAIMTLGNAKVQYYLD